MIPTKDAKAVAVYLVVDRYKEHTTKSGEKKIRGESNSVRLHVTGFGQTMSSTTDELNLALSNKIGKKSRYSLLKNFLTFVKAPLIYPTIINDEDNIWMIELSSGNVT